MCSNKLDRISDNLIRVTSLVYLVMRQNVFAIPVVDGIAITPLQFEILRLVQSTEKIYIADIGKRVKISKPQMTRLIDKLLCYGLVERQASTIDRRVTYIILTEKGSAFIEETFNIMRILISKSLSCMLDKESQDILNESLTTVTEALSELLVYESPD